MALRASQPLSLLTFSAKLLKDPSHQILSRTLSLIHYRNCPFAASCSLSTTDSDWFRDPKKMNLHLNYVREKVWDVMPTSVKEFPWKKAEAIALRHLLVSVPEALKWPLVILLVISFVSDVLYSIALNRELIIPLGFFVGCVIANFFKEILQELFPHSQSQERDWL